MTFLQDWFGVTIEVLQVLVLLKMDVFEFGLVFSPVRGGGLAATRRAG
jgi:hypothetical protein